MILIVDDDAAVRTSLTFLLRREGLEPLAVASPDEALGVFRSTPPDLILMDMNFSRATSGEEGLHLLAQARILVPESPVVLITAWGSIDLAVKGMRAGAADFITKPFDNRLLLQRIHSILDLSAGSAPEASPGSRLAPTADDAAEFNRDGIIGRSNALQQLLATVARVAPTDASVLILGENGTGKELIARAIHQNSRRAAAPFVEVNLGGIPHSLFESEMFGHVKGAFTGAVANRKGRFEMADRGTIFLDEVGDLDPASQVKMLRVLQEHTFQPLGDSRTRRADVRVVSATNADLTSLVASGTFREDLYYRLNLITLRIPPLRERREDIPLLINHFSRLAAERNSLPQPEFSSDAMTLLTRLPYPGNIRQLRNIIERAVIITGARRPISAADFAGEAEAATLAADASAATDSSSPSTLADLERDAILTAIHDHDGNLSRTALSLGITRQALYRKLDKFGITRH